MTIKVFHSRLSGLYGNYNETIKPLIADIEARYQRFPDSLLNEIRALNDHIARCYIVNVDDTKIEEELRKAEGHILRITLDCYKYLDVWFYDYIKDFDKRYTSRIDITLVNNGEFAIAYRRFQTEAIQTIRQAKGYESIDKQKSLDLYQKAYNIYFDLEDLIISNTSTLNWAKCRKRVKRTGTVILWILSVIISALITKYV
jgi:hypothetical protein